MDDYVCLTDEQATELEKLQIPMDIRYVIPRSVWDVLGTINPGEHAEVKAKPVRKNNAPFHKVEIPSNYMFRAKKELQPSSLAYRAAAAIQHRAFPKPIEERKHLEKYLISSGTMTERQAQCVMHYLAVKKGIFRPISENADRLLSAVN